MGSFAAVVAATSTKSGSSSYEFLLLIVLVFVGFYFLMIRPKQLEDRKRQAMIDAPKKNDKVFTSAGIYGTVVSLDPDHDRVVLRVDDDRGLKLTFSRSSVLKVVETSQDKAADSA